MDGKTSRGARRADGTRGCLLGAAEHGGRLLDHLEVGAQHNETSHFTELPGSLDLEGAVVTTDALHTVRANLDFPHARQAIKITRWRKNTAAGKASRQAVYAITSLASTDATARDLARLVREQWSIDQAPGNQGLRPGSP